MSKKLHRMHTKEYSGNEILEFSDTPVPKFLKIFYFIIPILGFLPLIFFWNGSNGWFDRGYWSELQEAAKTKKVEVYKESISSTSKHSP